MIDILFIREDANWITLQKSLEKRHCTNVDFISHLYSELPNLQNKNEELQSTNDLEKKIRNPLRTLDISIRKLKKHTEDFSALENRLSALRGEINIKEKKLTAYKKEFSFDISNKSAIEDYVLHWKNEILDCIEKMKIILSDFKLRFFDHSDNFETKTLNGEHEAIMDSYIQNLSNNELQIVNLLFENIQNTDDLEKFISIILHYSDQLKTIRFPDNLTKTWDTELVHMEHLLETYLLQIPNILQENVPNGVDETDNVELDKDTLLNLISNTYTCAIKNNLATSNSELASTTWEDLMSDKINVFGNVPHFTFEPKSHEILGRQLGLIHFETATKLSGSRFSILSGDIALLSRAITSFMLDIHTTEHGFTEINFPYLVKGHCMAGTGQLTNFADNFHTEDGFYLVPTGEVPMTNMIRDMVIASNDLPLRFVGYSECFRTEAGAAGRDTVGMFRQHQFAKVELISIATDKNSNLEHNHILGSAVRILHKLQLPFRVVKLCGGDTGFASSLTYDIEVFIPSQKKYREISSCSNCQEFQSRRMLSKYKEIGSKTKPIFVHTLNGSGLAVGRILIAILENYQNEDGSITIPEVLRPYMLGKNKILPSKNLKSFS